MKKKITKTKLLYSDTARAILFLICALIVVLLLPRQGRFRFEFSKNQRWMHESLVAPFNFPIYKTDASLENEKDSVRKTILPYYKINKSIEKRMIESLSQDLDTFLVLKYKSNNLPFWVDSAAKFICGYTHSLYHTGLMSDHENSIDSSFIAINIMRGSIYEYSKAHTLRQAYSLLVNFIQIESNSLPEGLFDDFDFNKYIEPNLIKDPETSNKVLFEMTNQISPVKGMIQASELIITTGEIITVEKFNILKSLKREYESKIGKGWLYVMLGQFMLVSVLFSLLFLFILNFRKSILVNNLKMSFILFLELCMILLGILIYNIDPRGFYVIPFALLPIVVRTFYDSRIALYAHITLILVIGLFAPNPFEFVFLNFSAGIVAILSLTNQYRRSKIFFTAFMVSISYIFSHIGMSLISEGSLPVFNWHLTSYFILNGILILTAYPLIYIFEKIFGFISDATLFELSDTNLPLLRELSERAPGTFHHSLQVANLADEAVRHIGGNSLLVRTASLYHDIGKMDDQIYFIENQDPSFNPHDDLEFEDSAKIIISHVPKGIEEARNYKLPQAIIDFIETHHGTTTLQYFYRSFIKKYPEKEVDINHFRYPGPKPQTKEMAVVMLADSVEAGSRSLSVYNDETISELVEKVFERLLEQEQFDEANITLMHIAILKDIFKSRLKKMYHTRHIKVDVK